MFSSLPVLTAKRALFALALTQNIGYGTIFYSYATLSQAMTAEFDLAPSAGFVVISIAMLFSGLCGARFGRMLDRGNPAGYMAGGSLLVGLIYLILGSAQAYWLVALAIVALQVVGIAVLYNTSFPLISRFRGAEAKNAITWLSLVAGFSSTLFWPVAIWGVEHLGWRGLCLVYAGLHLLLAAPAHGWLWRHKAPDIFDNTRDIDRIDADLPLVSRQRLFLPIAISFACSGVIGTVLMVHLVPLLAGLQIGTTIFYATSSVGPAMVIARIVSAVFWPNAHPLWVALVAAILMPVAILFLAFGTPALLAAMGLCIAYGIAHGLQVIVSGTLPLAVFGREGYGEILGRINRMRLICTSFAPALFAFAEDAMGLPLTLGLLVVIGLGGVLALFDLARLLRGARGKSPSPPAPA